MPEPLAIRAGLPTPSPDGVKGSAAHVIDDDSTQALVETCDALIRLLAFTPPDLTAVQSLFRERVTAAKIDVDVRKQYRNMADGVKREPRAMAYAIEAMKRAGLEAKILSIRGGTDGSAACLS